MQINVTFNDEQRHEAEIAGIERALMEEVCIYVINHNDWPTWKSTADVVN